MTKFVGDLLATFELHLTQIHPLGMVRVRHFEFVCKAQGLEPSVGMFNVFYKHFFKDGWCSFSTRIPGVFVGIDAPLSLHDWKHKFVYVRADVVPLPMVFRPYDRRIDDVVPDSAEGQEWYEKLIHRPAPMVAIRNRRWWRRA